MVLKPARLSEFDTASTRPAFLEGRNGIIAQGRSGRSLVSLHTQRRDSSFQVSASASEGRRIFILNCASRVRLCLMKCSSSRVRKTSALFEMACASVGRRASADPAAFQASQPDARLERLKQLGLLQTHERDQFESSRNPRPFRPSLAGRFGESRPAKHPSAWHCESSPIHVE